MAKGFDRLRVIDKKKANLQIPNLPGEIFVLFITVLLDPTSPFLIYPSHFPPLRLDSWL